MTDTEMIDQYETLAGKAVSRCISDNDLRFSFLDELTVEAKVAVLGCLPYLRAGGVQHPNSYVWKAISRHLTNYLVTNARHSHTLIDNVPEELFAAPPDTTFEDEDERHFASRKIAAACSDALDIEIIKLRIGGMSIRMTADELDISRRKVTNRLAEIFHALPLSIRERHLNQRWLLPQVKYYQNNRTS